MTTGYGELESMHRLNNVWKEEGQCIRLSQHRGDPPVISDLIFGINGGNTYSIEVKKITAPQEQYKRGRQKAYRFSYGTGSNTCKRKDVEFKNQLERQVMYCRRLGWIPLILLFVTHGRGRKTGIYLFDSEELWNRKTMGIEKSLSSKDFEKFHKKELYEFLFRHTDSGKTNSAGVVIPNKTEPAILASVR